MALEMFHENKDIFLDLGVRTNFNIPKLHFSSHYHFFIELYGAVDNYNTEYTERLRIDLAKEAYRATNGKDEYTQMTIWLERREKVLHRDRFIWRKSQQVSPPLTPCVRPPSIPTLVHPREVQMAKHPSAQGVKLNKIIEDYGATLLEVALARYVIQIQNPRYSRAEIEASVDDFYLPFDRLSVFFRMKFRAYDPYQATSNASASVVDSIHCQPSRRNGLGEVVPGRFDAVLIHYKDGGETGVQGYCVARVRCIFQLPKRALDLWFPGRSPPKRFAYVEWFTPFSPRGPEKHHLLYCASPLLDNGGQQLVSAVPINLIRQSVHLFPKFGPLVNSAWKSSTALDVCKVFYCNPFSDRFPYSNLF